LRLARQASGDPHKRRALVGDVSYLAFASDRVSAGSLFLEDEPEETMAISEFLALIQIWRNLVTEGGPQQSIASP
jgi:predicted ATPase